MEKRRYPHVERPFFVCGMLERSQEVLVYMVCMCLVLFDADSAQEVWRNVFQQTEFFAQNDALHWVVGVKDADKLVPDAFFGNTAQITGIFNNGAHRVRVNHKIELDGEPHGAHHTQSILRKALRRFPDGSDAFLSNIGDAVEAVYDGFA